MNWHQPDEGSAEIKLHIVFGECANFLDERICVVYAAICQLVSYVIFFCWYTEVSRELSFFSNIFTWLTWLKLGWMIPSTRPTTKKHIWEPRSIILTPFKSSASVGQGNEM